MKIIGQLNGAASTTVARKYSPPLLTAAIIIFRVLWSRAPSSLKEGQHGVNSDVCLIQI